MHTPHGLVENRIGPAPREYKLSHILADYQCGFKDKVSFFQQCSVPNKNIADGSLDFSVPARLIIDEVKFFTRLRLAWAVFRGQADVLRYE